jgi:hypothetical protein
VTNISGAKDFELRMRYGLTIERHLYSIIVYFTKNPKLDGEAIIGIALVSLSFEGSGQVLISCCAFKLNIRQKLRSIENPLSFCPLASALLLSKVAAYQLT